MSANSQSPTPSVDLTSFTQSWQGNDRYFKMLAVVSQLSRLFSESSTPYIDYRLVENLFCTYYSAINDARLCTAYDARIGQLGIGIKTFILGKSHKLEKVAEFNSLRAELNKYKGIDLARQLAQFRNERILFSQRTYGLRDSLYHIVGRREELLEIFNHPYPLIDVDAIKSVKEGNAGSISFTDGHHYYSFNNSKSVLMMRFVTPSEYKVVPIEILQDPFSLLEHLIPDLATTTPAQEHLAKGSRYVVLPLYGVRRGTKYVPEKSGLNQWNAGGRQRQPNEVYIPIPKQIHRTYPGFFPDRDTPFTLILPNGSSLLAKVCQDGGKALMSNPNQDLGKWILRDVLQLKEGELVTMDTLNKYGMDSILIRKVESSEEPATYKIDFCRNGYERYDQFTQEVSED